MKLVKIKSITHIGVKPALNISMKKNKNFILGNGILTHNTKPAQDALRNIMETYASNVFFVMTCNTLAKVIEPLRSRCITIQFAYPQKEEIYSFLVDICQKENMEYTDDGIIQLVELNYPSIRNCVLMLQDLKVEGKTVTKENVRPVDDVLEKLWSWVKEKKWQEIKIEIMQSSLDVRELNMFFWKKALDEQNIKIIQLTCKNEKDIASGADAKIVVVTSLIEMVK